MDEREREREREPQGATGRRGGVNRGRGETPMRAQIVHPHMDVKWVYEVGVGVHKAEQDLKGSPLKPEVLLRRKTGETKT